MLSAAQSITGVNPGQGCVSCIESLAPGSERSDDAEGPDSFAAQNENGIDQFIPQDAGGEAALREWVNAVIPYGARASNIFSVPDAGTAEILSIVTQILDRDPLLDCVRDECDEVAKRVVRDMTTFPDEYFDGHGALSSLGRAKIYQLSRSIAASFCTDAASQLRLLGW